MRMNGHSGLFDIAMGNPVYELTEAEIENEQAVFDAQEALEKILVQAELTIPKDDLHMRLMLSSIIESWRCVMRAREKLD